MDKKNSKKEKEFELKKQKELEDMLGLNPIDNSNASGQSSNSNSSINNFNANPLPQMSSLPPMDLMGNLKESKESAEKILESVVELYFPDPATRDFSYLKSKMFVELQTLTNLLFQQKTQQMAIMKLLEEIDNGLHQARNYEVLGSLQTSNMNIVKHITAYTEVLENSVKKIKQDKEVVDNMKMNATLPGGEVKKIGDGMKARGTKELIDSLRSEVEDVKFEEVLTNKTDAKQKFLEELDQEKKESEQNVDEKLDTDLF